MLCMEVVNPPPNGRGIFTYSRYKRNHLFASKMLTKYVVYEYRLLYLLQPVLGIHV